VLVALEPAPVVALREALFDSYQRLMPRSRESAPAVVVAIDEAALDARGQWPWPRSVLAELLRALAQADPAAIGIDLLLVEPDRSASGGDAALAQAVRGRNVVLGVAGLEYRDRRFPSPPRAAPTRQSAGRELSVRRFQGHLQSRPEIDLAAAGRGLVSVDSPDRVIRRVPMLARIGDVLVPALAVEMVRVATGSPGLELEYRGGERLLLRVADAELPLQSDGSLHPYFGPHDPERFISAEDVLSGKAAPELLRDKLVLVGMTGLGLLDFQATPLGERIPGVEVHAQILEQIFDGVYLRRPSAAALLEAALLAAAGLLLVALVPRLRAGTSALVFVLILVAFAALGIAAFKSGLLLDVAAPALGTSLVLAALLAATLAEADRQRRQLREAQARVAGELEAARRIQMGLLPEPRREFAGEERFELDALLVPARTVGGDFYDCFLVGPDRLFFLVADVSGKGLAASLFMALSKALLKSAALRAGGDPAAVLAQANAEIARDNPEDFFVTAFAGLLDLRSGRLEFCNAGHLPPYACRPGGAPRRLEHPGGPPLCVAERYPYASAIHELAPGEWLCVVTDGVTEASDPAGAFYGSARLEDLLRRSAQAGPERMTTAISQDVRAFAREAEQSDDLTLLCLRWSGASGR
jgi:serine phosphatase RsbU (regulator of sigma subunit)/CHASE2 domain-containing sensor protein